jgi:Na+-transporting NADH:ubiquinone oxidoreductase subunit NqrE
MARVVTAWERFKERLYPFVILIALVVALHALIYNIYIKDKASFNTWEITYLCVLSFLIILTNWCFLKTLFTDPGVPPLFWVPQTNPGFLPRRGRRA